MIASLAWKSLLNRRFTAILTVVVGTLISFFSTRRINRSIVLLQKKTKEIAKGKFDEITELASPPEIRELADDFNIMCSRLKELDEMKADFISHVSHELRTPLTALRTNIELLGRTHGLTDGQRSELISAAEAEVRDLSSLVGEVVDLASDRYTEGPTEDLLLDEIVAACVERAVRRFDAEVSLDAEPSPARGRPAALSRAVDNLLDNAVKWGADDGPIEVEVAGGRVSVRDHGPGIDDVDRDQVFDRFYRAEQDPHSGGSGIGLTIARSIVRSHDGEVSAASEGLGKGATFIVEMPLGEQRSPSF